MDKNTTNHLHLAPHRPLNTYYQDEPERLRFVRALFNKTAVDYDKINRVFSFNTGEHYRRHALVSAGLAPGMRVLDVAVGTGLVAAAATEIVGDAKNVIGLDLSEGMLSVARAKLAIPLIQSRMETLPLADETIDFLSLGYALRHVDDLVGAFNEFNRVLKIGGTIIVLELGTPTSRLGRWTLPTLLGRVVPYFSKVLTGSNHNQTLMRYCWDTVDATVPESRIIDALSKAGFDDVRCEREYQILRKYIGHKAS